MRWTKEQLANHPRFGQLIGVVPAKQKASDEQVRLAYLETGSVWAAGQKLGMCGQSVHERVTKMGIIQSDAYTPDVQAKIANFYAGNFKKGARGTLYRNRTKVSWKSAWRTIGGVRKFFRSRWEANYARYLEFQKQHGLILGWQHEPETFWFEGVKRGTCSYLPDFKVTLCDRSIEYHEVKGWMDARSITKIKRMAKYHPGVKLIIRDATWFKANQNLKGIIRDWE